MEKYRDLPMDMADAALVHVADGEDIRRVLTLDRRDFSVYRLPRKGSFTLLPLSGGYQVHGPDGTPVSTPPRLRILRSTDVAPAIAGRPPLVAAARVPVAVGAFGIRDAVRYPLIALHTTRSRVGLLTWRHSEPQGHSQHCQHHQQPEPCLSLHRKPPASLSRNEAYPTILACREAGSVFQFEDETVPGEDLAHYGETQVRDKRSDLSAVRRAQPCPQAGGSVQPADAELAGT